MQVNSQCDKCLNRLISGNEDKWGLFCKAFPDDKGIPDEVFEGIVKHDKELKGQVKGFIFEKIRRKS